MRQTDPYQAAYDKRTRQTQPDYARKHRDAVRALCEVGYWGLDDEQKQLVDDILD